MRQHKAIQAVNREQSDSFYPDKIEQYEKSHEEALGHITALEIEYSDQTLEASGSLASNRLTRIAKYYESAIKVLEFRNQSEKGLKPDDAGIYETLDEALTLEDEMALIDHQEIHLRDLNRMKDYCSREYNMQWSD
ncbi:MAG: hypothetical protein AAFY72_12760 [Cyanobacteria bacterium J06649_4]